MTVLEMAKLRHDLDPGPIDWPFPNRNRYAAEARMRIAGPVPAVHRLTLPAPWLRTQGIERRAA